MKIEFRHQLKEIFDKFLCLLYPSGLSCVNCGAEIKNGETRYNFCADCYQKLPFIEGHKCLSCGAPIKNEADYCDNCTKYDKNFDLNRAPLIYEGTGSALIKKLKFGNKKYVAVELAKMMVDTFISDNMSADIITYVPMTDKEIKERGYNQSELLAVEIAKRLNLPQTSSLVKIKETDRQKKLTAKERRENLSGVFAVTDKMAVKGKRVLLIDDVITTGATLNECSKVLKRAGATRILSLTACITVNKPQGETL